MMITTQDNIPGHDIVEILGIAQGNTVRARNVGRDFMAGLKNLVGGEISGYTQLMTEARDEAVDRMMTEAQRMGADAVVTVRFNTSDIMQSAAEIFVYGTAVKIKRNE